MSYKEKVEKILRCVENDINFLNYLIDELEVSVVRLFYVLSAQNIEENQIIIDKAYELTKNMQIKVRK